MALYLVRQPPRRRALLMILVMLPFWTSILVKSFAFTIVLGDAGLVNTALRWISGGTISLSMLFNRIGVLLGMMNFLLPFMVLPILANLLAQDPALAAGGRDDGSRAAAHLLAHHPAPQPAGRAVRRDHGLRPLGGILHHPGPSRRAHRHDDGEPHRLLHAPGPRLAMAVASAVAMVLLAITGAMVLLLTRVRGGDAAIL